MENPAEKQKSPLMEIVEPFVNLFKAPRALWGLNLSYFVEGITYFGLLSLLAIYCNDFIGLDDIEAGWMVTFLTGGITFAMVLLGATVDWIGVRKALIATMLFYLAGRLLIALAPQLGSSGWGGSAHIFLSGGILGIIIATGIYQPACYTAVRKFTTAKTAAMGYAMLYALMNFGAFMPGLFSPAIRRNYGIDAVYWVYVLLTVIGLLIIVFILSKKTIKGAIERSEKESDNKNYGEKAEDEPQELSEKIKFYLKNIPFRDGKFMFFIFMLIPVQTLFAHNWLTLPLYFNRAFTGIVSDNFEFFVGINSVLIFIFTPIVTAITAKKDTYKMMIMGTFVMAAPTFILVLGPSLVTALSYIVIMTIGEAMWQPRFLQWISEIAPKSMTGIYQGIGQFPWFLTKVITGMYSGWFLMNYCPENTAPDQLNTESMWLIYACIAIISPIALLLAKKWMGKSMAERVAKANSQ